MQARTFSFLYRAKVEQELLRATEVNYVCKILTSPHELDKHKVQGSGLSFSIA